MRKTILSLFSIILLCSCNSNEPADKYNGFFESAIEKMEKATTMEEVKSINEKLMQNLAVYSLSLTQEEYKTWSENIEANRELEDLKFKYSSIKNAKEKALKGE